MIIITNINNNENTCIYTVRLKQSCHRIPNDIGVGISNFCLLHFIPAPTKETGACQNYKPNTITEPTLFM